MKFLCSAVFCIVVALGMPQMARAADVEINEMNFPDQIFRNYVVSEFDKDNNGTLSEEEMANVTFIPVSRIVTGKDGKATTTQYRTSLRYTRKFIIHDSF